MSFRSELFDYIVNNYVPNLNYSIYYGSGDNGSLANTLQDPYYTMTIVSDLEQPQVVSESQGSSGQAIVQFTFNSGNQELNSSLGVVETELELLKNQVKLLLGNIGNFDIWSNYTNGIQPLGTSENGWFSCFFESQLGWNET
jgi:hypothetical protein